jgi:ribosomal-protein-alanine N-acetyltransferase
MEIVGHRGDRVRLVPPDRTLHFENALVWLNDPEVTATIKLNLGVSRRQEEIFFESIETRRDSDFVWAIVNEKDRHIGFIGLHQINWRNRWATGGLLIGDRSAWGHGYATDAVRVRTRFAFGELGLHRIEGHTMNPAMKRVFEKTGYQHEGVARRKFWRDGRYHDVDLFGLLAEDAIPL